MKQRYYFIDNLRWVTVVLVLIYHVFYNFNAQGVFGGIGGFAGEQWQDVLCTVLYPWFMTLMFVLAGASSRYALRHRTVREFRRERTRKLLVPSTLGLLVFGWVLGWLNITAGGGWEHMPAGMPFVAKYLIAVVSGTGPLWFIQDLYVFSLLLLAVCKLIDADKVEAWLGWLSEQGLSLVLFTLWPLLWALAQTQIDEVGTFDGLINLYRPIYYFVVFLVGYYIFSSERIHAYLARYSTVLCIAATAMGIVFCVMFYGTDYTSPAVLQSVWCSLYCWVAVLALIGLFKRRYDCATRFSQYMTRSSYGLYIVHMTICTASCLWLKSTTLPVWSIYVLALVATFAGSIVLWEVLRRIPLVRWCMFGIRRRRKTHPNPPCEGGNSVITEVGPVP
ncbi:MAG: acyltransferase [Bacteroidaceae bacterium]|nr:acyltransferase [Bacteroidaceae bacterium]